MECNLLVLSAIMGVALSTSSATVFTPLATDIHEPDGIYYQGDANMLRVDLQTVIGQGPCVIGDYSGCTLDDVNNDAIDSNKLWAWHIFIDNKDSVTVGYLGTYDYLLEGANLYKYIGDGNSWSWQFISTISHALNGSFAEFAIDKSLIDNATSFDFLFYGSNSYLDQSTATDIMLSN